MTAMCTVTLSREYKKQGRVVLAGLMMGPALLGFISDKTCVQTAMVANALVLVLVVAIFGLTADETRDEPDKSASAQPKLATS